MERLKRRKEDERGAVAIMFALSLTILLLGMSLAIDIGYQRTKTRDMQAIANVSSLDLSRRLDGKTSAELKSTMDTTLDRVLSRNDAKGDGVLISYELGRLSPEGVFAVVPVDQIPNAVKVTAKQTVQWGLQDRTEDSIRTAVAQSRIIPGYDCVRIGSYNGLLGTNGDTAIQAFFEELGQKASYFNNTSTVGGINYYGLLPYEINMNAVAHRLGYDDISILSTKSVPLKTFYKAMYDEVKATLPSTYAETAAYILWNNALTGAPSMPMSALMGDTVSGDVNAGLLDIYGGSLAWANGPDAPITVGLGEIPALKNSNGVFHYSQGARLHCAKPGQIFRTSPSSEPVQMEIETNGTLDPVYYPVHFYVPGLIDYHTTTGSPSSFKISTTMEPIEMAFNSVTCEGGVKTANFNIYKGDVTFHMGQSWSVGMNNLMVDLGPYGTRKLSFKAQIGFDARVDLAPKTASVSATVDELGEPLYFTNPHDTLSWNPGVSYFSNFAIDGSALPASDVKKIQDSILKGLVDPLLDVDNPDSLASTFLQALLGTAGGSLSGPPIIMEGDEIACGVRGKKTVPKLVG